MQWRSLLLPVPWCQGHISLRPLCSESEQVQPVRCRQMQPLRREGQPVQPVRGSQGQSLQPVRPVVLIRLKSAGPSSTGGPDIPVLLELRS